MAKSKSNPDRWGSAQSTAAAMRQQDQAVADRADWQRGQRTLVLLQEIQNRSYDTRPLKPDHVDALAESISVLGLLEPLVLDNRNRLLAGGHRLAALLQLQTQDPDRFTHLFPDAQVPVRVMAFDADQNPDLALQCEIAENEHRRDYTAAEVRAIADRLRAQGYTDQRGRPAKGNKALGPALEVIIGKHRRTILRYLHPENTTSVTFSQEELALRQIRRSLERWERLTEGTPTTPKREFLAKQLPKLLDLLDRALDELASPDSIQGGGV